MRDCVISKIFKMHQWILWLQLGTKIISVAFIDPILDLSGQKLLMLVRMRDIKIFNDITLNSPAPVDTFRY